MDTSSELVIQRYKAGVKLVRPDQLKHYDLSNTIGEVMRLPFNVYFYNSLNVFENMNESNAAIAGFDSIQQGIKKSLFNTPISKESAIQLIKNNVGILTTKSIQILDEHIVRIKKMNSLIYIVFL